MVDKWYCGFVSDAWLCVVGLVVGKEVIERWSLWLFVEKLFVEMVLLSVIKSQSETVVPI